MENEPTPEELAPSLGYFNFADLYWYAAQQLHKLKLRMPFSGSPVYFLYHQTVELYLKTFLRLKDETLESFKTHHIGKLAQQVRKHGMKFAKEDNKVFQLLDVGDVAINARYMKRGLTTRPSIAALDNTCANVRELVAIEMKKSGHKLRLFPKE